MSAPRRNTLPLAPLRRLILLGALLLLAACHAPEPTASGTERAGSPEASVQRSLALVRAGDFTGFWRHALPPADYAMLREDWRRAGAGGLPLTELDRARVDAALQQLAAADGSETADAQLQAWLAAVRERYGDQWPLLVGIGRALVTSSIAGDPRLSDAQKRRAIELVDALVPWAQRAPWFDPDRARQAVQVLARTTRTLGLRRADDLHPADFDRAMRDYATGFAALKQVLSLYGLSLDQVLASAHVVPLDYQPPYARVRIEYEVLGKPVSMESRLVQQNGRWYDQELIESVRHSHRELAAPEAPSSAPAAAIAAGP